MFLLFWITDVIKCNYYLFSKYYAKRLSHPSCLFTYYGDGMVFGSNNTVKHLYIAWSCLCRFVADNGWLTPKASNQGSMQDRKLIRT